MLPTPLGGFDLLAWQKVSHHNVAITTYNYKNAAGSCSV